MVSGILGVVSESTYDIAFGNTALGNYLIKVFWVGVVYFVGYITEAFAAATMGVHIDRWGALRSVFVFSVIACLVLILSGSLNVYAGINSIIFVVLVAGIMDFLNQLVNIAQTAAIPQAFGDDKNRLLTFSGLDSSVHAITGLVAPVIAGFIVSGFAELSSLFIVGLFYGTSAILLIVFLKSVRTSNSSISSADSDEDDSNDFYQGMSSGRIIKNNIFRDMAECVMAKIFDSRYSGNCRTFYCVAFTIFAIKNGVQVGARADWFCTCLHGFRFTNCFDSNCT